MRRNPHRALGRDEIRQVNQAAVFNAIHQLGPISRAELAKLLHLSAAAVSIITSDFIASGLVYEAEQGLAEGVGRKPILLRVDYDHGFAFGVKVSDTAVTTALTNLGADVIAHRHDPLPDSGVDTVIATVEVAVEALRQQHDVAPERVVGLGVNLPGIVDTVGGTVRASPLLGWQDVPIARLLQERLNIPALAENDVNALATSAAWFGSGKGRSDFLVLTLGRGVGLGIVMGGQVYRGPRGGAGEFGHTVLDLASLASGATGSGTVEAFLADGALLARARGTIPALTAQATSDDLLRLAQSSDPAALALFEEAGEVLGLALANLVNIFAPTLILLGGEGMRAAPYLLGAAERTLRRRAFCDLAEQVEIKVDSWGDEAWAQGAAALAASRFLTETAPFMGGDQLTEPPAASANAHP